MQNETFFQKQVLPLSLTVVILAVLTAVLYGEISFLNSFASAHISLRPRVGDILVGLTIYLKTSIDFAIFIGRLMSENNGFKSRIAIEIGTALGNALGTFLVLLIWSFFKEVDWLLALMVFLASLVLFRLAFDSLEHAKNDSNPKFLSTQISFFEHVLGKVNWFINPLLKYLIPNVKTKGTGVLKFFPLLVFSFTIPFILGLDDFAGYVPLFSVVNVYGFSIGVMLGHTLLNIFLFISPEKTIRAVKNPWISYVGTLAFIGLAIWGLYEVVHIII
jgi:hypothetical protein